MTTATPDKQHPVAVAKRVGERLANGGVRLSHSLEADYEQFMALKLAAPAMSDEAAALLVLSSKFDELSVCVRGRLDELNVNVG